MQPSVVLQEIRSGQTVVTAKSCYTDPELVKMVAGTRAIILPVQQTTLANSATQQNFVFVIRLIDFL